MDEGADFQACAQPNPPGIAASALRIAVNMAEGKELDESKLEGNIYYYQVQSFYTKDNFDDAMALFEGKSDDYMLDEWFDEDGVQALFK